MAPKAKPLPQATAGVGDVSFPVRIDSANNTSNCFSRQTYTHRQLTEAGGAFG